MWIRRVSLGHSVREHETKTKASYIRGRSLLGVVTKAWGSTTNVVLTELDPEGDKYGSGYSLLAV
jgi:hypothetical protein